MAYTINLKIINETDDEMAVVEKTCWYYSGGAAWTEPEGHHFLSMGGSGTSGMLRFKSSAGETFCLAVGVHNYKRWCDIITDLSSDETAMKLHPTYYDGIRNPMLWNQLSKLEKVTAKGMALTIDFFRDEDHDLFATLKAAVSDENDGLSAASWETNSDTSAWQEIDQSNSSEGNGLPIRARSEREIDRPISDEGNGLSTSTINSEYGKQEMDRLTPEIQGAISLPQNMRSTARDFWMISQILHAIGKPKLIDAFHQHDITDLWLPFVVESLPYSLPPGFLKKFQATQTAHLPKRNDLESGKHCHLSEDKLDDLKLPKSLRYISELGSGGYGEVFKVSGSREYALKRIHRPSKFADTLKMMRVFDSEKRILERITKKNCYHFVNLVGSYTTKQWAGLIMSPVADCNLGGFLTGSQDSPSKRRLLWKFFGCLASAVADLHISLDVRHKDIKPVNILVKSNKVLLTDFGLALDWSDGGRTTTHEDLRKSLEYCAPEVARNASRHSSSDIWSLGCVYLEMMTVLKEKKIRSMKSRFKRKDSNCFYYWDAKEGVHEWIKELRDIEASEITFENEPLKWVETMLQHDESKRPCARELRDLILGIPADPYESMVLSCDICRTGG